MNCLYIALFFNIVAGIFKTFIKSWKQLLYPRVIEVCHLPFEPRHDFLQPIIIVNYFSNLSRHHFVTFCQFITSQNSKNLFVNFRWTFTFALRNRMTECTSHLAGLWIGAAISNTSHSNKAGSTTLKRARLTGRGSRSTATLP